MGWFQKQTPVVVNVASSTYTVKSAEPVPVDGRWIPVTDQIPEYHVRVLVYDTTYGVLTGQRTSQDSGGDTWRLGLIERSTYCIYPNEVSSRSVTHWKPVPAAP